MPPACIPPSAGRLGLAVRVTGPPQPVVLASLRTGIFLTVKQIQSILVAFKIAEPSPGSGSGKNGRVIKVDLAKALIAGLFPDALENDKAFMVTSLVVRKSVKPEDAPELLVKLTSMLDTSEQQHFSRERKAAVDEMAVNRMKANAARAKKAAEEEDEDGKNEPSSSGKKRTHEESREEATGHAPASSAKAPRVDPGDDRAVKLLRRHVRAPKQFLNFFPLVSQAYFKWQPSLFRVGVEFTDKERFLEYVSYDFFCFFQLFFGYFTSDLSQHVATRFQRRAKNQINEVV